MDPYRQNPQSPGYQQRQGRGSPVGGAGWAQQGTSGGVRYNVPQQQIGGVAWGHQGASGVVDPRMVPYLPQQQSEACDEVSPGSPGHAWAAVVSSPPPGSGGGLGYQLPAVGQAVAPGSPYVHYQAPSGQTSGSPSKPAKPTFPAVSKSTSAVVDQMEERVQAGRRASSCGETWEAELLVQCEAEYNKVKDNYLRGCKWSPDGRMLMTNSNDNVIRIFNLPVSGIDRSWNVDTELTSSQQIPESDLIYDYAWYTGTNFRDPNSCLFATAVRDIPIHMFSALTGELVGSFRSYNHVDEIIAAHSVGFTIDGKHLVAGFNRQLRCFDTNRPGRDCVTVSTVSKDKDPLTKSVKGQRGILSCFAAHPSSPKVVAAGAFNGDVAVYDLPSGAMSLAFEGQVGGITHISFSPDGNYLFAGGRKDPEINVFDMRNPEKTLYVLYRYVATNQRMYFDIDRTSSYLVSGHHNGHVTIWDLKGQTRDNQLDSWPRLDPVQYFVAHQDTTNGVNMNPKHPILATCSGQRHFPESIFRDEDDSPLELSEPDIEENCLKLWKFKLP